MATGVDAADGYDGRIHLAWLSEHLQGGVGEFVSWRPYVFVVFVGRCYVYIYCFCELAFSQVAVLKNELCQYSTSWWTRTWWTRTLITFHSPSDFYDPVEFFDFF
jgi:hypothetical protein